MKLLRFSAASARGLVLLPQLVAPAFSCPLSCFRRLAWCCAPFHPWLVARLPPSLLRLFRFLSWRGFAQIVFLPALVLLWGVTAGSFLGWDFPPGVLLAHILLWADECCFLVAMLVLLGIVSSPSVFVALFPTLSRGPSRPPLFCPHFLACRDSGHFVRA